MSSFCWKCEKEVDLPIHFKATCDHCFAYLHACKGCRFYQLGKPNDCLIPGTEQIADREANNYCDDFKPILEKKKKGPTVDDVTKRLFGDD